MKISHWGNFSGVDDAGQLVETPSLDAADRWPATAAVVDDGKVCKEISRDVLSAWYDSITNPVSTCGWKQLNYRGD